MSADEHLTLPCQAFWDFVRFVDYQGSQDMDLLLRIANRYTFCELQMFKAMYQFFFDLLSDRLKSSGSDGDEYRISYIISQGPEEVQHWLQAAADNPDDEELLHDVPELESFVYVFHAFDPVNMLYDGIKKPLLSTKAFNSPPFIAELVKDGVKIPNIRTDFTGFEVLEEEDFDEEREA